MLTRGRGRFGVWSRITEDMPLHGGTAFSKTWPNRNPNASVAWDGKILSLFSETVAMSVFLISKALNSDFFVRNQGARRSMADAKAQKEDMESKLAELQSINKDEFRTPGFTLEVVMNKCSTSLDLGGRRCRQRLSDQRQDLKAREAEFNSNTMLLGFPKTGRIGLGVWQWVLSTESFDSLRSSSQGMLKIDRRCCWGRSSAVI